MNTKTRLLKAFNFEVYTCNYAEVTEGLYKGSKAGEITGWDIKFPTVFATDYNEAKEVLKTIPYFDCIILFNYSIEIKEGSEEFQHYANGKMYFFPVY